MVLQMAAYIYETAVMDNLLPMLSTKEYSNILCTCKEFKQTYDRKTEWKRRSPPIKTDNYKENATSWNHSLLSLLVTQRRENDSLEQDCFAHISNLY